jgi:hypothetical protein
MSTALNLPRGAAIVGALWLIAAIGLSAAGLIARLRPPAPQIAVVVLTIALTIAMRSARSLRRWLHACDLRALVGIHVTRLPIGLGFIWAARHEILAPVFANPAGWGDVAVGALALLLILTVAPSRPAAPRWYGVWNVLGLIDLVLVVLNAARVAMANPESMRAMLHLPWSLLPTFWVPILLASHFAMLRRVAGPDPSAESATRATTAETDA